MSKKYSMKTFGTDDADAFGKQFSKESWCTAEVVAQHSNITHGPVKLDGIPVFVYELDEKLKKDQFKLTDVIFDDNELSYIDPKKSLAAMAATNGIDDERKKEVREREETRAFVGYDIEYLEIEPSDVDEKSSAELISHQFYVAHNDQRVGIIILTIKNVFNSSFNNTDNS